MSLPSQNVETEDVMHAPARPERRRVSGGRMTLAVLVGAILALSLARWISDADSLTAAGTLGATLALGMPIALAGLGGLWSERAGMVNIGLEGMMILGTWGGAAAAFASGNVWVGVLGGIGGGMVGGLIHAVATVTFGVDHIVSGVAINLLALGVAKYLAGLYFDGKEGGGPSQSPPVPRFSKIDISGVSDGLGKVVDHHWFLISDVAGLLQGLATQLTWLTIVGILLFPLSWFVLWRTAFGLRLRSCGESPSAAETLGVRVYTMKFTAIIISGGLAGLAGTFLVDFGGLYREGQTGGRGYIGLAAMIFGNWRPGGLAAGAALFGYTDAVQSRGGATAVFALLIFVAVVLGGIALMWWWTRRTIAASVATGATVLVVIWYAFASDASIPAEVVSYTPQIITLVVLALASQRLRMPAADGVVWRRGQGG